MAFLPRPVTMMMSVMPESIASSMTYWVIGLSTSGSISLGCAFGAGRKRVPRPAAGKTALGIVAGADRLDIQGSGRVKRWREDAVKEGPLYPRLTPSGRLPRLAAF